MKNARELLEEFTATSFRDPRTAAEMFTEDGAFEMPYLESFDLPGRYEGREAIEGFFRFVRDLYPDMDLENIRSSPKSVAEPVFMRFDGDDASRSPSGL
jgi:hypothetical protein